MGERLEDMAAVITGSDSGIGQATAIAFAKEGADVVINYLHDEEGAEQTRKQVEEAGRRAIVVQADQTSETQVNDLFQRAIDEFGKVDILVNNAGIDSAGKSVVDMPTDVWDRAIKTNLYGYFFCARRFIQLRNAAGGGGKIINISSVHDEIPRPGSADYDCTKAATKALTRTLALEVAEDKINVNSIGPGMVLTPFNQQAIEDKNVYEQQVQSIPLKRAAQPEEIAALATYLASRDSDYVTGASFYIDGGLMQNVGQGA